MFAKLAALEALHKLIEWKARTGGVPVSTGECTGESDCDSGAVLPLDMVDASPSRGLVASATAKMPGC
jgi:hypothetical protein